MTQPDQPHQPPPHRPQPHQEPPPPPERTFDDVVRARVDRRRDKIRAEVRRNRAGGHRIPTWVLATVLGLILAGWLFLIITS